MIRDRRVSWETNTSSADALYVQTSQVPSRTIRRILGVCAYCSAGHIDLELSFCVEDPNGNLMPFYYMRGSYTANMLIAGLTNGASLDIIEGYRIRVSRNFATSGSTISVRILYEDNPMPVKVFYDPIRDLMKRRLKSPFGTMLITPPPGSETPPGSGPEPGPE